MTAITVSENLLSTTIYNHGTLSTTLSGPKSTPGSYFPYPTDPYNHTMFTESSKTSTIDSQKISTTPTNSNQHVHSATASSVYRLTTTVHMLNEASKSTIGTKVTTHYNNYTTTSVSSDISVEQQMTTTQYKAITRSRSGDIAFSFKTLPLTTSTNMFQALLPTTASSATPTISSALSSPTTMSMPYPLATQTPILTRNGPQLVTTVPDESFTTIHESEKGATTELPTGTEQGIVIDTDPSDSLFTTAIAEKSTQAVTLREAVAWALLSLMTLFFTVLCIHVLCRQKWDNKTQTAAYEMADESSKTSNTLEMNIYESIAD